MALVLKDRAKETTTTTGTGTYTLAGAVDGFESFAGVGDGNTTYYACTDGTDWEVGVGTYTASGTTLARTTILESSNSDAAVNWSAGEKNIFITQPSEKAVFLDGSDDIALSSNDITGTGNINITGTVTASGEVQGGSLDINGVGDISGNLTLGGTVDATSTSSDAFFFRSSNATTTNFYLTNTNATTNNTANLYFAPANNIGGAFIRSEAEEDFSVSANRTANMQFHTRNNGTFSEAMRITPSGNTAIGNTSPQTRLFVGDGSGTEGITIYSGTTGEGQLRFADGTSGSALYQGRIEYNHSSNKLFLGAGGTTPVAIDSSGNLGMGDNKKILLGTGDDLQIYHDGTHSRIDDVGTGALLLQTDGNSIQLNKSTTENMVVANIDGSVDLYYDNSKKFETKSDGVEITGELQATSLDINGNSDLAGVLTLNGNLDMGDSDKILLGAGDDLQIYHNGSDSYIDDAGTGKLFIRTNELRINKYTGEFMIRAYADSSVELYHNNSLKMETTSTGISVTGSVTASSDLRLKENVQTIENAVDKVKQIDGVTFDWKDGTGTSAGVIAQQVMGQMPMSVDTSDPEHLRVNYDSLIGLLVQAVKEQQETIDNLEARLSKLET